MIDTVSLALALLFIEALPYLAAVVGLTLGFLVGWNWRVILGWVRRADKPRELKCVKCGASEPLYFCGCCSKLFCPGCMYKQPPNEVRMKCD